MIVLPTAGTTRRDELPGTCAAGGREERRRRRGLCTRPPGISASRHPLDLRVREDVQLVTAAGRELGDHSALAAGLEPVKRIRWERILVTGVEHDLAPDRVGQLAAGGGAAMHGRVRGDVA